MAGGENGDDAGRAAGDIANSFHPRERDTEKLGLTEMRCRFNISPPLLNLLMDCVLLGRFFVLRMCK